MPQHLWLPNILCEIQFTLNIICKSGHFQYPKTMNWYRHFTWKYILYVWHRFRVEKPTKIEPSNTVHRHVVNGNSKRVIFGLPWFNDFLNVMCLLYLTWIYIYMDICNPFFSNFIHQIIISLYTYCLVLQDYKNDDHFFFSGHIDRMASNFKWFFICHLMCNTIWILSKGNCYSLYTYGQINRLHVMKKIHLNYRTLTQKRNWQF